MSNSFVVAAPPFKDSTADSTYAKKLRLLPNNNVLFIQEYPYGRPSTLYDPAFNVLATIPNSWITGMGHLLGVYSYPAGSSFLEITDMNTGRNIASGSTSYTRDYGTRIEELPGNLLLIKVYDSTYLRIIDLNGNTIKTLSNVTGETVEYAQLYNGNKVRVKFKQTDGTIKDYWIDYVTYTVKQNPTATDLSVGVYYADKYNVRDAEYSCMLPNRIKLDRNTISKDGSIIANMDGSTERLFIYNENNGRLYMVVKSGSTLGRPRMISNAIIDRITDLQAQNVTSTSAKVVMNRNKLDPSYNIKVQYKRDGDQWIDLPEITGLNNSIEITGLLPDTNYSVRVRTDFIDLCLGRIPSDGDWQPEYLYFKTKTQLQTDLEKILSTDIVAPDDPNNKGLVTKNISGKEYVDLGKTFSNMFARTTNLENSVVPVIQSVRGANNATATTSGSFTVEIEAYGATEYRAKSDVTSWTAWTTNNTITINGIGTGVKKITVEARNAAGKISSKSMTIFSL